MVTAALEAGMDFRELGPHMLGYLGGHMKQEKRNCSLFGHILVKSARRQEIDFLY